MEEKYINNINRLLLTGDIKSQRLAFSILKGQGKTEDEVWTYIAEAAVRAFMSEHGHSLLNIDWKTSGGYNSSSWKRRLLHLWFHFRHDVFPVLSRFSLMDVQHTPYPPYILFLLQEDCIIPATADASYAVQILRLVISWPMP